MPSSKDKRAQRHQTDIKQGSGTATSRGKSTENVSGSGYRETQYIGGKKYYGPLSTDPNAAISGSGETTVVNVGGVSTAGGGNHGNLSGLGADDHSIYVHTEFQRNILARHNFSNDTSPFNVTGTTVVDNLNADQADGYDFDQPVLTTSSPTFTTVVAGYYQSTRTSGNGSPMSVLSTDINLNFNAEMLGGKKEDEYFTLDENEVVTGIPQFNGGTSGSTAPFGVDSSTLVTQLNADKWDGYQFADYLDQPVRIADDVKFKNITVGTYSDPNYSDGVIQTDPFVSGWTGAGYKIDEIDNDYHFEIDNMTIRGTLSVYELLIQQIRATNGALFVTSCARVYGVKGSGTAVVTVDDLTPTPSAAWQVSQTHNDVESTSTSGNGEDIKAKITTDGSGNPTFLINKTGGISYAVDDTIVFTDPGSTSSTATLTVAKLGDYLTFEDITGHAVTPFASGDLILTQRVNLDSSTVVKLLIREVVTLNGLVVGVTRPAGQSSQEVAVIEKGDDFVRIGNTDTAGNPGRQGGIYLTSDDTYAPFIDIFDDVSSVATWNSPNKTKVRLGKLDGITDTDAGLSGSHANLYGLYSDSVYLKGHIHATSGDIGGILFDTEKMYVGTGTHGNSNTKLYAHKDGDFSLGDKLIYDEDANTLQVKGTILLGDGTAVGAGLNWTGAWDDETTYSINDGVSYLDDSYISKTNSNLDNVPITGSTVDTTNWSLFIAGGVAGDDGADAVAVSLNSDIYTFAYEADGTGLITSHPTTINLTGSAQGFHATDTLYYHYTVVNAWTGHTNDAVPDGSTTTGYGTTKALTIPTDYNSAKNPYQIKVNVYKKPSGQSFNTSIQATDTISVAQLKEGAEGDSGLDARTIKLIPSTQVIVYDDDDATSESTTVNFTVETTGTVGTKTYAFLVGSTVKQAESTTDTWTLPDADEPAVGSNIVVTVKLYEGAVYKAQDIVTIYAIQDGDDSHTGFLTNESHVVSTAADGTGYNFGTPEAGGTFKVFDGSFDKTGEAGSTGTVYSITGGTDNTITWTKVQNNLQIKLTVATGLYELSAPSPWGTDSETFTLTAIHDGVRIDKTYTITKSKTGDVGADAYTVLLTNESHTVPVTSGGSITYTGSGTNILAFNGTDELDSVTATPGAGQFKLTGTSVSQTSNTDDLTVGSATVSGDPIVIANHAQIEGGINPPFVMTITYTLNLENLVTVTKTQTITKSIQGVTGTAGSDGNAVDIVFVKSASQPDTPTASSGTPDDPIQWYTDVNSLIAADASSNPIWSSVGTKAEGVTNYTWQTPVQIEGQDGDNGSDGISVAEVSLYYKAKKDATILADSSIWSSAKSYTAGAYVTWQSNAYTAPTNIGAGLSPPDVNAAWANVSSLKTYVPRPNPSGTSCNYNFTTQVLTHTPAPSNSLGWTSVFPSSVGTSDAVYLCRAVAAITGPTGSDTTLTWSDSVKYVESGEDGDNGVDGLNNAIAYLYQINNSNVTAPDDPTGDLLYTFSTGVLSGTAGNFNSWSATRPTNTRQKAYRWVIAAPASSLTATDTIEPGDWAGAVIDMAEGYQSATVFLYQRTGSNSSPAVPDNDTTYTFSTKALAGSLDSWSQEIPTSGGDYIHVTTAVALAINSETTDTIEPEDWSTSTTLAEKGDEGTRGSRHFYLEVDEAEWIDADANGAIDAALGGTDVRINRDTVTLFNGDTYPEADWATTKYWNTVPATDTWTEVSVVIDGNLIVHGTVGADQVNASEIIVSGTGAVGSDDLGSTILTGGRISLELAEQYETIWADYFIYDPDESGGNSVKFDEFWERGINSRTGVPTTIEVDPASHNGYSAQFGDNSEAGTETGDQVWAVSRDRIPYNPNKIYKISARVLKKHGIGTFYIGYNAFDADGNPLNVDGSNSYSSQHYVTVSGSTGLSTYQEYVGYFGGTSSTASDCTGTGTSVASKKNARTGTVTFAPLMILNHNEEVGTYQVDWIKVEVMSGGSTEIEGGKISTGIITSTNWDTSNGTNINLNDGTIRTGGSDAPKLEVTSAGDVIVEGTVKSSKLISSGTVVNPADMTSAITPFMMSDSFIDTGEFSISAGTFNGKAYSKTGSKHSFTGVSVGCKVMWWTYIVTGDREWELDDFCMAYSLDSGSSWSDTNQGSQIYDIHSYTQTSGPSGIGSHTHNYYSKDAEPQWHMASFSPTIPTTGSHAFKLQLTPVIASSSEGYGFLEGPVWVSSMVMVNNMPGV